MPLFFFDIRDGMFVPDDNGVELADIEEARIRGALLCEQLLRKSPAEFWQGDPWEVVVRDDHGLALFTIAFTATALPAAHLVLWPSSPPQADSREETRNIKEVRSGVDPV